MEPIPPNDHEPPPIMARVVDRNIRALLARRKAEDRQRTLQERLAERITKFTGSMAFVYFHVILFAVWIAVNLIPGLPKFDPTFVVLAMFASVEAIFLSTFVLITQNRMAELADKRADLDLQVSLLTEHEVTRLITLVAEMAARMGIEASQDSELDELKKDVAPERVLDQMEKHQRTLGEEEARKAS